MGKFWGAMLALLWVFAGCSHARPQVIQVFSQVNRTFDPATQSWNERLACFAQISSSDGTKVFDRMHLIHDGEQLYFTLNSQQWSAVERPGESWVGFPALAFPGKVPTGTWRVLLVTRAGQKAETTFEVPPPALGSGRERTEPVSVKADAQVPGRYQVRGWPSDYLVWSRDAEGTVFAEAKTKGESFTIAPGARSFMLYTYDKERGEGLVAGPFVVQDGPIPADR